MKIAHFSPLPPQRSGIADYCAELLPYLRQKMQVDAYVDTTVAAGRQDNTNTLSARPLTEFLRTTGLRLRYDLCLYHMGNHPTYHEAIYNTLLRYPGVAVLHETNLHAFYLNRLRQPGVSRAAYIREMGYAHGLIGIREARQVHDGGEPPVDKFPLFQRIAHASLGIIVHTEHARQILLSELPEARVACIPLGVELPPAASTDSGEEALPELLTQFSPHTILLGSFGYIGPTKRIDIVLQALAQLRDKVPDFRYLLIGQPIPGYQLTTRIRELGLNDIVYETGFVDDALFRLYLKGIHIGVNLRSAPTGGEMSATLMHLLARSKPVVVSNIGGFASLPDDCVFKVDQNEDEISQLVEVLGRLISDESLRLACGKAAEDYVAQHCSFPQVAQQYVSFLQDCVQSITWQPSPHD